MIEANKPERAGLVGVLKMRPFDLTKGRHNRRIAGMKDPHDSQKREIVDFRNEGSYRNRLK